jgi:hypothetical protein
MKRIFMFAMMVIDRRGNIHYGNQNADLTDALMDAATIAQVKRFYVADLNKLGHICSVDDCAVIGMWQLEGSDA